MKSFFMFTIYALLNKIYSRCYIHTQKSIEIVTVFGCHERCLLKKNIFAQFYEIFSIFFSNLLSQRLKLDWKLIIIHVIQQSDHG